MAPLELGRRSGLLHALSVILLVSVNLKASLVAAFAGLKMQQL